jgi:hypothetical protein
MPTVVEQALEFVVGLMLVVLGVDVVRRIIRQRIHFHVHRHADGQVHVHAHSHSDRRVPPHTTKLPAIRQVDLAGLPVLRLDHASQPHHHEHLHALPFRALAVGMVHGLAGSAALVVLSLQTVASVGLGLGYIVVFGFGSIAGMAALSATIALPLRLSGRHLTGLYRSLTASIGIVTMGIGCWIVYRIGFAEGLIIS